MAWYNQPCLPTYLIFCQMIAYFSMQKDQMKKPIDTLEASSTRKLLPGSKDNASQMEEEKFQKIISDPEIKEILNDKRIQHLIHTLKENPAIAQRYFASNNIFLWTAFAEALHALLKFLPQQLFLS